MSLIQELLSELRDGVDTARLARFVIATLEGGMLMTWAIDDLPHAYHVVVTLSDLEELRYAEIADVRRIP